jgi:hypothetical protein
VVEVVFLDIGGVLYDDRVYAKAWRRALREEGADFTDEAFDREYAACKAAQDRSFRRALTTAFLGPDVDLRALEERASRHWHYPPSALHADVVPCLTTLREAGYRLGVIANQPSRVREAMLRDGLVPFFEVWGVSEDLGLQMAIEAMKEGKKVARKGWNGKGIFIELQRPDEFSKMTSPYIFIDTTGLQTTNPDAPKSRVPWLASQTDMLAEDWVVVE